VGVLVVAWASRRLAGRKDVHFEALADADARKALLLVGVMTVPSFGDFSSLPQPLVAVPAFLFVALFDGLVPLGLGFAGGAMLWMVAAQVVPDALHGSSRKSVALALGASTVVMLAFEAVLLA